MSSWNSWRWLPSILSVLVALWDSLRFAPETEEGEEQRAMVHGLMSTNWATIMRMKAWLRLRLEKWRKRAHEHAAHETEPADDDSDEADDDDEAVDAV